MKRFEDDLTEPRSITYSKEYLIDGLKTWSNKLNDLKQDIDCIYKALQAYIVEVEKKLKE